MSTESETMKRHPLAIAWDEWLASDEGQQAVDVNMLARYTDRYLENRLKRAFDAGTKAAATPTPADTDQLVRLREQHATALTALKETAFAYHVLAEHREAFAVCRTAYCVSACRLWNEHTALRHALGAQEGE